MTRLPVEFFHDASRAGTQHRGVTRTTRSDANRYGPPCGLLSGPANLTNRITLAQTDVERSYAGLVHPLQCTDVGMGDIQDMDVVTQARAVGSIVVISVNGEILPLTGSGLEQQRNDVRFRMMALAKRRRRAGSVEIAKGDHAPTIRSRIPLQNALQHQLSFPVGIHGILGAVFIDGNGLRCAVHSRG